MNFWSLLIRRGLCMGLFVAGTTLITSATLAFTTAHAVAGLAGLLYTSLALRRSVVAGGFMPFRSVVGQSWPYWLHTAFGQARSLDVTVLAILGGPAVGAIYGVSARLMGPLRLLPSSLGAIILPHFSRGRDASNRAVVTISIVVLGLVALVISGIIAFADPLIELVLGPSYVGVGPVLQLFCVGVLASCISAVLAPILQGWNDAHFVGLTDVLITVLLLIGAAVGGFASSALVAAACVSGAYWLNLLILALRVHTLARRRERGSHGRPASHVVSRED